MDWSIKFKQPQRNLYGHSTDVILLICGDNVCFHSLIGIRLDYA